MKPDPATLLPAVTALVTRDDAAFLYDTPAAVVQIVVGAKRPVALSGDAAVLNPLLDLASVDKGAYDRVLEVVDDKRKAAGYPPLRQVDQSGFDKRTYMRDFMAHKRLREKRAVLIENLARSDRDQLRGVPRMEFSRVQSAKWKARLDAVTEKVRVAHGGAAPREALDLAREQFWQTVDQELDAAEEAVRKKMRR